MKIEKLTHDELLLLPKIDLHVHLDGSMRLSTILDLARQDGIELPANDEAGLAKAVHAGQTCESLEQYLEAFDITLRVLQGDGKLRRAAFELVEDAHAENVRYMEVRFSPILHTREGLPLEAVVDAVLDGLREGERTYGVQSGVIICGIRNMSPEISYRLAQLAVSYKNEGVVGFDLAGAEYNNPPKEHLRAFYLVTNNNINVTLHAGEAAGAESVHQAIHYNKANRIGHGTRLFENGDLMNYVNDHRIALEICLKSNVQTRAVPSLDAHPLPGYFRKGLRVTLNTDNRLITDTTVTDELLLANQAFGFSMLDIKKIIMNGFKSMFQPYAVRRRWLQQMREELGLEKYYTPEFGTNIDEKE
jgi:adenosine deaminase